MCNLVAQKKWSQIWENLASFLTMFSKYGLLVRVIQWLGTVWDSRCATISVSERRLQGSYRRLSRFLKETLVSARGLSSFVGKIMSAQAIKGILVRVMTGYCAISIADAKDWDSECPLDGYCKTSWHFRNLMQNNWILEQSMTTQLRNRISSSFLMRAPVDAARTWT